MEKDVFLAIPSYSGKPNYQCIRAADACVIRKDNPAKVLQMYVGDSLVTRTRNELARLFLESDCKYLLFIDDDLEFEPEHIARLRSHNLPIVAGLYFKKNLHHLPVLNRPGQAYDNGLLEVGEAGTGFLMIRRDVFGAMKEYFDIEYAPASDQPPGARWDFFPVGRKDANKSAQYLSEDYFFCQRATEIGYKIYVDQNVVIKHHGQMAFPPLQTDMLRGFSQSLHIMNGDVVMPEDELLLLRSRIDNYLSKHHKMEDKIEVLKPPMDVPAKG